MIHLTGLTLSSSVSEVVAAIGVLAGVTFVLWRWRSRPRDSFLAAWPPKDTVVLQQFGHGLTVPSVSPFVIKLETYLRAANIPYINAYNRKPGPREKLPWIQYNDHVVPDSQLCIQFLNSQRGVNLNKRLSPQQAAIGHLVRVTAEESLYWVLLMCRLVFDRSGDLYRKLGLSAFVVWYMRRSAKPRLWSHGIGRYTQEEVMQIMEDDLGAISTILGDRRFLFGDQAEDVSEFDCALFGQLCQLLWQTPGTPEVATIVGKYPNLVAFCENMRSLYWPDWEQMLYRSHTTSS